jgi:ATP sulfurylase
MVNIFDDRIFKALKEMAKNVLAGNVPMSDEQKKQLSRYKKELRALATQFKRKNRIRRIIQQSGRGFLPALIPLVITAISSLV